MKKEVSPNSSLNLSTSLSSEPAPEFNTKQLPHYTLHNISHRERRKETKDFQANHPVLNNPVKRKSGTNFARSNNFFKIP